MARGGKIVYTARMKRVLLILIALGVLGALGGWLLAERGVDRSARVVTQETHEQLVGTWQSVDDANAIIVFDEGGVYRDYYDGENLGEGAWQVHGAEYGDGRHASEFFIETTIDGGVYGYALLELTDTELAMSYLARGNTLVYRRVSDAFSGERVVLPQNWQLYTSDAYGFTMPYPSEWEVVEVAKPTDSRATHEVVVREREYDPLWRGMVSVFVYDNQAGVRVREWLDTLLAEEDAQAAACREAEGDAAPCVFLRDTIERERTTTLAGQDAIALELFEFDHMRECVYAAHGGYVFGLCAPTATNPNDPSAAEHAAIAERIRESFVFVE